MSNDIERLEQRIKAEQALLRKKRKEQRTKLVTQLGSDVLKTTNVSSREEFDDKFEIVRKGQSQIESNAVVLSQLKTIADNMHYNGRYWQIENLPKVASGCLIFEQKIKQPHEKVFVFAKSKYEHFLVLIFVATIVNLQKAKWRLTRLLFLDYLLAKKVGFMV